MQYDKNLIKSNYYAIRIQSHHRHRAGKSTLTPTSSRSSPSTARNSANTRSRKSISCVTCPPQPLRPTVRPSEPPPASHPRRLAVSFA